MGFLGGGVFLGFFLLSTALNIVIDRKLLYLTLVDKAFTEVWVYLAADSFVFVEKGIH